MTLREAMESGLTFFRKGHYGRHDKERMDGELWTTPDVLSDEWCNEKEPREFWIYCKDGIQDLVHELPHDHNNLGSDWLKVIEVKE